ncbi:MAG: hypothetical protein KKC14_01215 [Alphaproteobacteria bacterium]|nr:hypothetical protein [Alphaproteobacteria bacterium]
MYWRTRRKARTPTDPTTTERLVSPPLRRSQGGAGDPSFWVIKIVATTLGETGGDVLSMTLHLGYALSTVVFFGIFVIAVSAQVSARMYRPFLYWTVILATTTAGTTMSDYLDRTAGLGYIGGSALLVTILVSILALWRFTLGSVSVNNIVDRKFEVFNWTTTLFSNCTLGYERALFTRNGLFLFGGGSYTKDFVPPAFRRAYGSDPAGGKLYMRIRYMGSREWF